MFRELMGQFESHVIKVGEAMERGMVVTKDYANNQIMKADNVTEQLFIVDYDYQPEGAYSDTEVSDYSTEANTLVANQYALAKKPMLSAVFATDKVITTSLVANTSYVKAGTTVNEGKFVVAVATDVVTYRYLGTYNDNGNTLYKFEVVEQHTV